MSVDRSRPDDLRGALWTAAATLGVTMVAEPVYGFGEHSIGCRAIGPQGDGWLRVITERAVWAHGEFWVGNAASAAIEGVAKPTWLASHEWEDGGHRTRADLMTFVPVPVCSSTMVLRAGVELPDRWWESLRRSLDALAAWPTERTAFSQELATRRLLAFFGGQVDPTVGAWTTAHADLHWANLTAPDCHLLDWEGGGAAPAGYDAALLYCTSLLQPDIAARVHEVFADSLDNPDGVRAQLCAASTLLLRAAYGHDLDLAAPLHRHVSRLVSTKAASA
ncbi:MAG: aminoglycoside phosphotransferase [Egibacteraceae bacterium]